MCFNQHMRVYRLFVAIMLVLFSIGTVHAASMGVAMQFSSAQDMAAMHCHDMDGDGDSGDNHAKPHHGNLCNSCAACVPVLVVASGSFRAYSAVPAQNPHVEASYTAFVGKLRHRPPISA